MAGSVFGFFLVSATMANVYYKIKLRNKTKILISTALNFATIIGYSYSMDYYINNRYKKFIEDIKKDKQIEFYLGELELKNKLLKKKQNTSKKETEIKN